MTAACVTPERRARKAQAQRDLYARRTAAGLCLSCGQVKERPARSKCDRCLANASLRTTTNRRERPETHSSAAVTRRLRTEVLNHYSHKCACCGEDRYEFLAIDHVNNDGAAHRRMIGRHSIITWLKRNNYPDGFQLLCHNCNMAKGFYGQCPHAEDVR